jgi:hypothetical protein
MSDVELKVLCWNVFHGRDEPPNPALRNRRRFARRTLDDGAYLQVGRALDAEFTGLIAAADWSICLLQEVPPRWQRPLARAAGGESFRCLTSRNQLRLLTGALARVHPDLVGAWEGGSNLTLVRPPWRIVAGGARSLLLNPLRERGLRERRRMCFVRLARDGARGGGEADLCVANLHASHYSQEKAEREVLRAAKAALDWAGGLPLLLGGDFNVRLGGSALYRRLEEQLGLSPVTSPDAIDHVLARGLTAVARPARWADERRDIELPFGRGLRRIRLSDHAPVEAAFHMPVS